MTCQPAARDAVRAAARTLDDQPDVIAVDVLDPSIEPHNCWTVEIVVHGSRVPAPILKELAAHDVAILTPVQQQGTAVRVVGMA